MIRKTECTECPFKRSSAPGYLGEASYDPDGFIAPHWYGGLPLPCHLEVDWTDDDPELPHDRDAAECHGYARLMRNCAKLPHDRDAADALQRIPPDRERFFSHLGEFCEHHKALPDKE